jgi:hypothetical protein
LLAFAFVRQRDMAQGTAHAEAAAPA